MTGELGTGLLGTASPAGAAVPRAALLESMATMPSAVAVVTALRADGGPCGLLATSVLNGTKVYVLAVSEHGTRRIRILGAARFDQAFCAGSALTQQQAVAIVWDQRGTGTQTP